MSVWPTRTTSVDSSSPSWHSARASATDRLTEPLWIEMTQWPPLVQMGRDGRPLETRQVLFPAHPRISITELHARRMVGRRAGGPAARQRLVEHTARPTARPAAKGWRAT